MTVRDGRGAFCAEIDVSRETLDRLELYAELLEKWNPTINLVSKATINEIWTRHFLDSAQLCDLVTREIHHWADLGAGGGFPGLVVAVLLKERSPETKMTLVESDKRKATFLRTAVRELAVNTDVVSERIEGLTPLNADVLSARALAPLVKLCEFAERHLAPSGVALFPKGANHAEELKEALASWTFKSQEFPSKTNLNAVILKLGDIARV